MQRWFGTAASSACWPSAKRTRSPRRPSCARSAPGKKAPPAAGRHPRLAEEARHRAHRLQGESRRGGEREVKRSRRLYQARHRARLDRPVVRDRALEGRQARGLDAQPGHLRPAPGPLQGSRHERGGHRGHHVEGAGCYGHNGADDVALDAALLARVGANRSAGAPAVDARGRVRLGALRRGDGVRARGGARRFAAASSRGATSSGATATRTARAAPRCRRSPPPRTSPKPFELSPAVNPALPAGGADRNCIPLYDFADQLVSTTT